MAKSATKTEKALPYLVGGDIGFGGVKMFSSYCGMFDIPSTVVSGQASTSRLSVQDTINVKSLIVTTVDGTYFVGENAMYKNAGRSNRTQENDRAADPHSRVLFETSIALSVPHEDGEYDVFFVTGLPNRDYDLPFADNLREYLNNSFEVEFHLGRDKSIKKKINMVHVELLRQPEGSVTYSQFQFDPNYKESKSIVERSDWARQFIACIDIGHFTTDYSLFLDSVIIDNEKTCGSTIATTEAYELLRAKLQQEFSDYNYQPTDKDLDRAVREKKIFLAGSDRDVTAFVDEAAEQVASIIAKDVLDAWGNEANRVELIVLTGGGAHIFENALREEFAKRKKQNFMVLPTPQFANVIGYYMFGAAFVLAPDENYDLETIYTNLIAPYFGVNAA